MLDAVFSACSTLALVGWVLLIALPRHRGAHLAASLLIPAALSTVYLLLIVLHFPGAAGGFGSLTDVALLFSNPALLLAGWVHYLAFDLFVGAWAVRDSERRTVPHTLVIPCLLFIFMLGPIGLLAYLGVRRWRAGTLDLAAA
jgi:hypothetical protein